MGSYLKDRADKAKGTFTASEKRRNTAAASARARANAASRQAFIDLNDIAPMPKCRDPERREFALSSLKNYCETYHAARFPLAWSQNHLLLLEQLDERIRIGGRKAQAMPRGSGKTTIFSVAAEWAILSGLRSYIYLLARNSQKAEEMLEMIKASLQSNELVYQDFPEVCHPIWKLENEPRRCLRQHYQGELTHTRWESGRIAMPRIAGSSCAESVIQVAGITSSQLRGSKHIQKGTGAVIRPDYCLLDDVQDDESAASPNSIAKRERIIEGAVLGMAGPTTRMACFMACTVIKKDDLSSIYLDRRRKPEWAGTTVSMVQRMPRNMTLWDQYKLIRDNDLEAGGDGSAGTEFYRQHREQMDEGAMVSWEDRVKEGDISPIQTALNLALYDPISFASEYQNQPIDEFSAISEYLSPTEIAQKTRPGVPKAVIPPDCHTLTAFVDVHKRLLYYATLAIGDGFTCHVVDYGTFPRQDVAEFAMVTCRKKLEDIYPNMGVEAMVYAGLSELLEGLMTTEYARQDGETIRIARLLVDANWGETTQVVRRAIFESKFRHQISPSHGQYVGASRKELNDRSGTGIRRGLNWYIAPVKRGQLVRAVQLDSNYWKSFVHARLATPAGDPGSMTLFDSPALMHRMLANQLHAEYPVDVQVGTRRVREWNQKPQHPDNHFFDCLVGCCVAANIEGIDINRKEQARRHIAQPESEPYVPLSELRARMR